ncbi:hypothetical protein DLJ53_22550 [Acuticoccus sediminis]|uniref:Uncharacterized protein n=1 Tax=Acuticoccus sediminis TaxID=2184697 RepID=A0A8B2NQM9_9HYPH|nr:hypothetical protein [Acuticoccus sediminis]RAH99321.1 hypothetical protein DLJ53_22550 [Acuticoccus sediminis]
MPALSEQVPAKTAIPARQLGQSERDVADYIEQMSGELVSLAEQTGLGFLAYLLEVAREEAALHRTPQKARPMEFHGELPPPNM